MIVAQDEIHYFTAGLANLYAYFKTECCIFSDNTDGNDSQRTNRVSKRKIATNMPDPP